jgi:SAM-dependent methyltransferase
MSDDSELKAKHAKMWASGDYPSMVETFLLPLGPRLIEAAGIGPGQRVLDIAAGTGNASLVAAATGADVVASDLTPELLDAGRARADAAGLTLGWEVADAENLPFEDESFDVVMSSIGIMFAPHHEVAASEMARVCKPGGTIALLSWTPEGQIGALFRTMKPFAPPPPPGAQPPPLWGNEEHLDKLFGDRVAWQSHEQATLPEPAATSWTRSPALMPDASTRIGPSEAMTSLATAGYLPSAHMAACLPLRARSSSLSVTAVPDVCALCGA